MNAYQARPLLAFWLLAAVAVVISSAGLRTHETDRAVPPRPAAPSTPSTSPAPAPGEGSHGAPNASATSRPALGQFRSAAALEYAVRRGGGPGLVPTTSARASGEVEVAAPRPTPDATERPSTSPTRSPETPSPAAATGTARPTVPGHTPSPRGHGSDGPPTRAGSAPAARP